MFYSPRLFFKDPWIYGPLVVIVVAQVYMWAILLSNISPSSDQIFLHYNIAFGIDKVGDWWKIYFLPAGGLLFFLLNFVLANIAYSKDKFMARLLSFWVFGINSLLSLVVFFLVEINY